MSEQIDTALDWGTEQIRACSETPRLDAELLLSFCLGKPRSYLYAWPDRSLSDACWEQFRRLVGRRLQPLPIAYLLGRREFFSMEYAVTPSALVPRPETELLVELALAQIGADRALDICDLGTGSGIIAITLKKLRPECRVVATDIDTGCLDLAAENAARHGVEIEFLPSDWFSGLRSDTRFDLILSNPPYIAAGHPFLGQGDLPAEPAIALTPGETGLEALEIIVGGAPRYLSAGGLLIVEHGYDQQAPVSALFAAAGFVEIHCANDFNGLPRATRGQLPPG